MASRAHVIHDYSFRGAPARPRREMWYRDDDPVVLPRSSSWSIGGGLVAAAFTATALIAASAYTVLHVEPPPLTETPTAPLVKSDWQPDPLIVQASVTQALSGPARRATRAASAASQATTETSATTEAVAPRAAQSTRATPRREKHDYVIDDSAPGTQPIPDVPSGADALPKAPYPDPTLTPPEGIAPPLQQAPENPAPELERENPYR